jgi:pimeloyl-ACP methyl ester carboxylesterase
MGGEETTPEKRRTSRDIRRSLDRGLGVELGSRLRSLSHRSRKDDSVLVAALEKVDAPPIALPEIRYLLISPLTPPISTVLAPVLGHKFWSKARGGEAVVGKHATLVIYGDSDMFTSAKRIREWSEQLTEAQGSRFSSVEVAGAGHFWVESGVEEKLRAALAGWECTIR